MYLRLIVIACVSCAFLEVQCRPDFWDETLNFFTGAYEDTKSGIDRAITKVGNGIDNLVNHPDKVVMENLDKIKNGFNDLVEHPDKIIEEKFNDLVDTAKDVVVAPYRLGKGLSTAAVEAAMDGKVSKEAGDDINYAIKNGLGYPPARSVMHEINKIVS